MKKILLFCLMILISIPSFSYAQNAKTSIQPANEIITLDLNTLPKDVKDRIIELRKNSIVNIEPGDISKWKDITKIISEAIKDICSILRIEVNEFVQSPVGIMTVALIVWKLVGSALLHNIIVICISFGMLCIILWSYKKIHVPEKIVTMNDKKIITDIKYVDKNVFRSGEAKTTSAVFHALSLIATFLITLLTLQ